MTDPVEQTTDAFKEKIYKEMVRRVLLDEMNRRQRAMLEACERIAVLRPSSSDKVNRMTLEAAIKIADEALRQPT